MTEESFPSLKPVRTRRGANPKKGRDDSVEQVSGALGPWVQF